MSDIESRPARGRSSTRGGRGSYSGRGGPRGGHKQTNGHASSTAPVEESLDDQGELGEMKKKYQTELTMLKELFPDWTDTDLVFALEEADGDIPAVVDKITSGAASQFSEVKKAKDRARSKAKEEAGPTSSFDKAGSGSRARGRGTFEGTRGGRGRGSDRGRGGHRGGRGGHATTNGAAKDTTEASVPTTESTAWDATTSTEASESARDVPAPESAPAADTTTVSGLATAAVDMAKSTLSAVLPESGAKKSWASMFAAPKPAPAPVPKKAPVPQTPAPAEAPPVVEEEPAAKETEVAPEEPANIEPEEPAVLPHELPVERPDTSEGDAVDITPSKIPLTEENVEHLPDESNPPATLTVASTAGSADPRNLTPLPQAPIGSRPSLGGYATSANRLAGTSAGRSASFQRRVKEQQEAVVMPGHNAVDRAAVQFGSLGLGDEAGMDVDEEREEPETRQAPQHSPPSQPRTSLPPAPLAARPAVESSQPEAVVPTPSPAAVGSTPKQAPGLPPASAQNQQQIQDPTLSGAQALSHEQQSSQFNQYNRNAQHGSGLQYDLTGQAQHQQKPYDPFGHQTQHSGYDQYGIHPQQHQQQQSGGFGGLSSAQNDYPSYYTSDHQQRSAYNQYYGAGYGAPQQQDTRSQSSQNLQDPSVGQQRSASGFGSGPSDATYGGSQTQGGQQATPQSRFNDMHAAPGSGNNTPLPSHQQAATQQQQQSQYSSQQQQQQQQQQGQYSGQTNAAGFPYGHQYYNSPYPQAYQNQFNYAGAGYGGQGYGAQQGKQGGYAGYGGAQQGFGGSQYDTSSPAPGGHFGQSSNRGSSALGGLDDYGRAGSSQGFGSGIGEGYPRSASGFGGAQGGYGQQQGGQQDSASDALKPFGSNEAAQSKTGPSPRPGSAVGSQQGQQQQGQQQQQAGGNLPPPQSGGGFYQGFGTQGQYLGGLGGAQGQQQSGGQGGYGQQSQGGYGGYGGFGQTYGQGYGNARGGWGQNYSQQGH